jgi:epoxyqueuosine reductase
MVALGNALHATEDPVLRTALTSARDGCSALVREHIDWALSGTKIAEAS